MIQDNAYERKVIKIEIQQSQRITVYLNIFSIVFNIA